MAQVQISEDLRKALEARGDLDYFLNEWLPEARVAMPGWANRTDEELGWTLLDENR